MIKTRRMVFLALLTAMAGVLHIVESWLPVPLPLPGAKLGLANIVSLLAIVCFSWQEAIYIAILRVLLGGLLGGALLGPSFIMSMGGALISILVMTLIKKRFGHVFSLVGISLFGAAAHNITQVSLAALIVYSPGLLWYMPYLLLFSVPTGVFTGLVTNYLVSKVPVQHGFSN